MLLYQCLRSSLEIAVLIWLDILLFTWFFYYTSEVSRNPTWFQSTISNILSFSVSDCKAVIDWRSLGILSTESAQIPDETGATHRTFIFAFVYLILYSALIFTALYSLYGINNSCLGRKSFPIFFAPWIFVCISIVILDVLATTYYIIDSISTAVSFVVIELVL